MDEVRGSWRTLVDHWPGVLLTLDGENRISSLNRNTQLIDAERDIGRDLFDFIIAADHAAVREALAAVRAGQAPLTRRMSIRFTDGPPRSYDSQLVPLPQGGVGLITNDVVAPSEARQGERSAQRSEQRLRILAEATRSFSEASRSPDRLFDALVHELGDSLRCASALCFVTDDGAHFRTSHTYAPDTEFLTALRAHLAAGGPRRIDAHPGIKYVVETGKPFFAPHLDQSDTAELDADGDLRGKSFAKRTHLTSALVVPLCVDGRVIGVLTLNNYGEEARLDDDDLALAQSLAAHASVVVAATRLLEKSDQMAARVRLLADASREFSEATGDYGRLLGVIARRLGEVLGDLCEICTVDEEGTLIESGAVYHPDPEVVALAGRVMAETPQRVGEGIRGRAAAYGQPVLIPNVSRSTHAASTLPPFQQFLEHLNVGSVIAAPMLCRGKVVGVATLLRSGSENPYTEADLELVRGVADHAALAVANARSYAAERAARAAAVSASEARHDSEVAHRLLFEASPVPLLVFDVETYAMLAVNDAALRLYGYTLEELLRMRLPDLRADNDAAFVKVTVDGYGDGEARGTALHRRKDGTDIFIEYTSRLLVLGGRRARITVVGDRRARRDAEEMRALLAAVVQSSNDAIVTKRLDGTITSWNSAAERLFGYSAAEALERKVSLLIPPDRMDEERALLARLAAGERVEHHETIRRRKDQTDVAVSLSLAQILDSSGAVIGTSKTARDLTSQRNADLALRSAEEQLRQAQKMEAVGRLAGGIAHDFNNVLSVILSYTELILADLKAGDPLAEDIEEIGKAAVRAADLTRQLLMFSRQQVVARKVIDLNEVLAGMDKMVRRIIGDDIDLVSAPALRLGRVLADPSSVEQVIMNLVVNARDAMPTGGKLTIETANVSLDGAYAAEHLGATEGPHVMLAVSDTGVGMTNDVKARIFEPFFTTKCLGKGTGLGLSTVFGIAQQAGGSVWVYSEVGAGTTFKVYFPRVDSDADIAGSSVAPMTLRGSETILLVEDQEQVRAVAHAILGRNGYRVLVAQNGVDALALGESHEGPIDLLLTDVVMPQMSGATLAREIGLRRPGIKILCMSGYTDDSVVRHGVLESEVAFLQKPFTPESLTRKVREVLDALHDK